MSSASVFAGWPVIAVDPSWELRQGPRIDGTLETGEALSGSLVWSTSEGFSTEVTVAGEPLDVTSLSASDLSYVALVIGTLAAELKRLVK